MRADFCKRMIAAMLLGASLLSPAFTSAQPIADESIWSGFDIRDAQNVLSQLGYDPGPSDGKTGPQTDSAVAAFQRDRGLSPTGTVDAETKQALLAAILAKSDEDGTLVKPCSDVDASALDAHLAFVQFAAKHKWEVGRIYSYRTLLRNHYEGSPDPFLADLSAWLAQRPRDRFAAPGLLVYDHDGAYLRAWLITAGGLRAYHQVSIDQQELRYATALLRRALAIDSRQANRAPIRRGVSPGGMISGAIQIGSAIDLMTRLLLPQTCWDEFEKTTHLIVIPTSDLWTIPFAVLKPGGRSSHLVDHVSLVMAHSLIDLTSDHRLWSHPSGGRRTALVVGNPTFPADDPEWFFPQVPGAESEANAVAGRFGGTALIGAAANKATVVERSRNADVLYFATHSVADSSDPLRSSFLLLAGTSGAASRWTLDEIQRTRFSASLAVLSACQTGLGEVFDAGILSVALGFHISGVPRVVLSLWQVDDAATRDLMVAFVDGLLAGELYPPEALRAAMLRTREKYPHPSNWASFTLFGALW